MGIMSFISKGLRVEKRETITTNHKEAKEPQSLTLTPPADNAYSPTEQDIQRMVDERLAMQAQQAQAESSLYEPQHLNNAPAFKYNAQPSVSQSHNTFQTAIGGTALNNRNILVITPHTNADVTRIVENLQRSEACVIDLEQIPVADAQRRLDFLSGVICAIDGAIQPLDAHKYILTPQGLGVRRDMQ